MLKKWFGRKGEEPSTESPRIPSGEPGEPPAKPTAPKDEQEIEEQEEAQSPRQQEIEGEAPAEKKKSRWSLFSRALAKTRKGLKSIFTLRRALDEEVVNEIEA